MAKTFLLVWLRSVLTLSTPQSSLETTFANSAVPDEPARNEPSHQGLHCLLIVFKFEQITFSDQWDSLEIWIDQWNTSNIGMEQPIRLLGVEMVKKFYCCGKGHLTTDAIFPTTQLTVLVLSSHLTLLLMSINLSGACKEITKGD